MKKIILFMLVLAFSSSMVLSQTTTPVVPVVTGKQTCKCNPNGWQPGYALINNVKREIKCGYQFSLKCNDIITINEKYLCLGNCAAKYSAVLKNATTGVVVMSYASFTFPWTYHFTTAGNYSLEITPMCGDAKCTPCRFFFTVICPTCDCNVNGWQPFTATIANNPPMTVKCGYQFSLKKGQPFKLDGKYLCKGDCLAKYVATLKNSATGALVQNYPAFTFPWMYTFMIPGNYTLEIIPMCGSKRCTPCIFYFTVQ